MVTSTCNVYVAIIACTCTYHTCDLHVSCILCVLNSLPPALQESNVNLRLTVVSTAGFGDQINKENSVKSVVSYLDEQFEQYITEELKIKRDLIHFHDTRVHVCLYFIAPTGHS